MKQPMRFEAGKFERKWMAQLDDALASNPDDAVANCDKGILLLELCRSEEALECFGRVLREDPSHAKALIGRGTALTMLGDYDGADKCFNMVPRHDEAYDEALRQSDRNKRYRDRRGMVEAGAESDGEREFNDGLESWMSRHIDHVQNLQILLDKFRRAKDGHRRKRGNAFHAWLVKRFYEHGGPLKVVAVECKDTVEPNTDIDIMLSDNVYVQAWYGKAPLGYAVDEQLRSGDSTPLDLDWCEELKPIQKKLRQLPSNTGKCFVINYTPGDSIPAPPLHHLCSERKCVTTMNDRSKRVTVIGTSDFKYRKEACRIANALGYRLKFILGDWDELGRQGRDPMQEEAYGHDVLKPPYTDLRRMDQKEMLDYAKHALKHPQYDDLAKLDRDSLLIRLWYYLSLKDNDCEDD